MLGLLNDKEHEDALFIINSDTLGQICKFHNIKKKDVLQAFNSSPMKNDQKLKNSKANSVEMQNMDSR